MSTDGSEIMSGSFFLSKPFLDSRKCWRRLRLFGLAIRTIKDPNNLGARLLDHNPFLGVIGSKRKKHEPSSGTFFGGIIASLLGRVRGAISDRPLLLILDLDEYEGTGILPVKVDNDTNICSGESLAGRGLPSSVRFVDHPREICTCSGRWQGSEEMTDFQHCVVAVWHTSQVELKFDLSIRVP